MDIPRRAASADFPQSKVGKSKQKFLVGSSFQIF
jgi:hypothetical protein